LDRESTVTADGVDLTGNNPGAENIAGGLSTIEEKSLGAIAKTGTRPIADLLDFCGRTGQGGLYLLDGPSFSPESMTGFVASGTQLILFTTGPGNSYCSLLAPTIKVGANPASCMHLTEQLDFDASNVLLARQSLDEAADALFADIVDFASGTLTWGEATGQGSECFMRIGASL
jgi:altronate dehydratase large subunit